ncbi:hypothetical protein D3C85_1831190 [compost metagenome]
MLLRAIKHLAEKAFGRIVTMTIIEQEFLTVKIIVAQTIDCTDIGVIFGNFILQLNIRNQTIITIVNGNL